MVEPIPNKYLIVMTTAFALAGLAAQAGVTWWAVPAMSGEAKYVRRGPVDADALLIGEDLTDAVAAGLPSVGPRIADMQRGDRIGDLPRGGSRPSLRCTLSLSAQEPLLGGALEGGGGFRGVRAGRRVGAFPGGAARLSGQPLASAAPARLRDVPDGHSALRRMPSLWPDPIPVQSPCRGAPRLRASPSWLALERRGRSTGDPAGVAPQPDRSGGHGHGLL